MSKKLKHKAHNELRNYELDEESEDLNIKAKLETLSLTDSIAKRNLIKYYHKLDLIDKSILKLSEYNNLESLKTNLTHIVLSTKRELSKVYYAYLNFKPINMKNKEMEWLLYTLTLDTQVSIKSADVSKAVRNIIETLSRINAGTEFLRNYLNVIHKEKCNWTQCFPYT